MAEKGEIPNNSELARQTGLSRQAVIKWVNPHYRFATLDADTLLSWMEYFDVDMSEVVGIVRNEEDGDNQENEEDADEDKDS